MLNTIIRSALRYRLLVLLLSLALFGYGSYLATSMPIDVFPDLDRPRVIILTECPGLATEEAETLVTQPIETALLGASGVQAVRSQTTAGLNVIYVEFDWNTEIRAARQTVQERLTTLAGVLPEGIRPQMTPPASIMGQIMIAGMYRQKGPNGGRLFPIPKTTYLLEVVESRLHVWNPVDRHRSTTWNSLAFTTDDRLEATTESLKLRIDGKEHHVELPSEPSQQMALRTIADWVIRPRLLKVTGVAEAFIQGGDRKQYQVLIDPAALIEYGVTLLEVESALKASNMNTSGGFAITGESERPIRILGRLGPEPKRVIEDLKRIPVRMEAKRSVLLGQLANVVRRSAAQTWRWKRQRRTRRCLHDRETAAHRYA